MVENRDIFWNNHFPTKMAVKQGVVFCLWSFVLVWIVVTVFLFS